MLEIGTGSGYQTAVLSRLVREVVSVERYRTLAEAARARLETLGYHNVESSSATALRARPTARRSTASSSPPRPRIPEALVEQLAVGGIMVLPLGPHAGSQTLVRLTRTEQGVAREDLIGVRFVRCCRAGAGTVSRRRFELFEPMPGAG